MTTRIESNVEQAARDLLESLDWRVAHRQNTSPDAPTAGRAYGMPCTPACCRQVEDQSNSDG